MKQVLLLLMCNWCLDKPTKQQATHVVVINEVIHVSYLRENTKIFAYLENKFCYWMLMMERTVAPDDCL